MIPAHARPAGAGPQTELLLHSVEAAADLLDAGGLVALPTETVYGLGAVAIDPRAVARVFQVKGRPATHPLIMHLAEAAQLDRWAARVPGYARRLADRLWPGPMTLVLPRTRQVPDLVTGGQDTVGLRVPDHRFALELLAAVGRPVAAPSANRFGRVSPTTAQHVLDELGTWLTPGRDGVLDGGASPVGVESTILDCTGPAPVVLRPGAVDAGVVAEVGGVAVVERVSVVRAPGTLSSHYAPRARVELVDDVPPLPGGQAGLIAPRTVPTPPGYLRLADPRDAAEYAQVLYAALRQADSFGLGLVIAVPTDEYGVGVAVNDRLRRAAAVRG